MSIEEMISKIEKKSSVRVLDVYECNDSIYIAECINSITKSAIGDFYYKVSKDKNDFSCFNPAENPMTFISLMKNKKTVYTNKEVHKLLALGGLRKPRGEPLQ